MSRKYHIQERAFLNEHIDMRAFIVAVVEDTRDFLNEDQESWKWGRIDLTLADCNRHVTFEFDLSSKEHRDNSLFKIRKIAEVINAFQKALEIEAESIMERQSFTPNMKAMSVVH